MTNEEKDHGAEQIIRSIDNSIAQLAILRGMIQQAGPALDGWRASAENEGLATLIQFFRHRDSVAPVDARIAACALSPDWHDDGDGAWRCQLPGQPGWKFILHSADLTKKPSTKIAL